MSTINARKFLAAVALVSAVLLCLEMIGFDESFADETGTGTESQTEQTDAAAQDGSAEGTAADTAQTAETSDALGAAAPAPTVVVVKKPNKVKRLKLKSKVESQVTLRWKKVDCSGYKIKYSRKKDFSGSTTIRVSKGATSYTIKNLAKGKRYYFQVRAYRKKSGKVAYGKWSEVKSIKVHKHVYVHSESKVTTGTLHTYKCTCGKGYYKTDATDGKTYDGYLYSFSTCVPGRLQKTIGGSVKSLAIKKSHTPVKGANGKYVCSSCGQSMKFISLSVPVTKKVEDTGYTMESDEEQAADGSEGTASEEPQTETVMQNVTFAAPRNTNSNSTVAASVQNIDGETLNYKIYWQKSSALVYKYEKYRSYFKMHGCSTCALTTVLNAVVPKYENYTPDMVLEEVIRPVVGESTFKKNFSKSLRKQMPIGLRGISKVLKANGVKHKYVYKYTKKSAAKEIKEHLKSGNPVIFMIRRSTYAHNPHAMVMLGLDNKGQVIVGDSSLCSASKWGTNNRLIKYNTKSNKKSNTVTNISKFFKYSTKSVKGVTDFYNGKKGNIGYILVYK